MPKRRSVPAPLKKGPFRVSDARQAGLRWIDLQGADWRRIGPGQYVSATLKATPELTLEAVSRRLPASAAFAGRTAAWLHGLDVPPCEPVEVVVPDGDGVSARAWIRLRRAQLRPDEIVSRKGLPVTSMLRTLADLSARLDIVNAVIVTDMALHAKTVDMAALDDYISGRRGKKGIVRLRRVRRLAAEGAESPMETRLRLLLVLGGLPRPQVNTRVEDERGEFLGRLDLYYPEQRVAVEYDGSTHKDSIAEDNRRQNRLLGSGIHLLRFTAGDVFERPNSILEHVRGALQAAKTR